MFAKGIKKKVCQLLLGSFVLGAVGSPLAVAQEGAHVSGLERQELNDAHLQLSLNKITDEEKKFVIDTNLALLKLATGIDVKSLPFISSLFPKSETIDYERIARDVSRIITKAFIENNEFDQKAKLATAVTGLKRLALTETKDDQVTLAYMGLLDNILHRTSQEDLKDIAAGYWASAAQMNLNAMAYRMVINPNKPELKKDLYFSAHSYRKSLEQKAGHLRALQENELGKKVLECYVNQYGRAVFWNGLDNKAHYFDGADKLEQCRLARHQLIHERATNTEYLEEMARNWFPVQLGAMGGEAGLEVYRKLMDPATEKLVVGHPVFGIRIVRNDFTGYALSPETYSKHFGTICKALDGAIVKSTMEKHFPADAAMKAKLLSTVGCQG